jgi:hypothetical protein
MKIRVLTFLQMFRFHRSGYNCLVLNFKTLCQPCIQINGAPGSIICVKYKLPVVKLRLVTWTECRQISR